MLSLFFENLTKFPIQKAFFEPTLRVCKKVLHKEANFLSKEASFALSRASRNSGGISLILVSDQEIRRLNASYRNKNTTTDVLTFSFLEGAPFPSHSLIGEIYISVDTALMQAEALGHDVRWELQILFIHGVLHAFGFEHENDGQEAEVMRRIEAVIAKKLSFYCHPEGGAVALGDRDNRRI